MRAHHWLALFAILFILAGVWLVALAVKLIVWGLAVVMLLIALGSYRSRRR